MFDVHIYCKANKNKGTDYKWGKGAQDYDLILPSQKNPKCESNLIVLALFMVISL